MPETAWQMAKAAAPGIDCISGAAVFSVGSDGTDGPTGANVNDVAVALLRA